MEFLSNIRMHRIIPVFIFFAFCSCSESVKVSENQGLVTLENDLVSLEFNLEKGLYDVWNLETGTKSISGAALKMNEWSSTDEACEISWNKKSVENEFGQGLAIELTIEGENRPGILFNFCLYEDLGFLEISSGLNNSLDISVQLKEIYALADGSVYQEALFDDDFAMVDGFSGGEPLEYGKRMYSPLTRENALKSRNNILVTNGSGDSRSTLVMGGFTYHDFEKFASVEQARRVELQNGNDGQESLLAYLNLPDEANDQEGEGPKLELKSNVSKRTWDNHQFRCTETATSAVGDGKIIFEASQLDPQGRYYLGLSWWRGMRHGDRKDHKQSVYVEYEVGGEIRINYLIKDETLPRFDGRMKEDVKQAEIPLPSEANAAGKFNIIVEKTPDEFDNSAMDPKAYLSEVWLRDGSKEALIPETMTDINDCVRPRKELVANMYANDPVGKRVDPGDTYSCPDQFYIDVCTKDPFIALEKYGENVKKAQEIELSMYDFPSVCLWYAEHSGYGGSNAENTTQGAVNEMKTIKDRGFLKYSRAAVRLVPDSYLPDNQQGWWDDEHWQKEETDRNASENGRYVKPYETSEKWGKAVTDLGGVPLTYFQAGFRSEDYAEAFPGHMLFNKAITWRGASQDDPGDLFTSWNKTWTRNRAVWGYDYTDPGFLTHLTDVYSNLSSGGVKGLMFDYPGYAWSYGGGLEDKYSTTASAYRNIFRMPYEGLGPGSYVHERNMERGTDVSIGYVASMRTENDTDRMDPTTVTRCGLRWYKNRVLYNQDTDSKNLIRLQDDRDAVRAVLTMAYVTTGRLLLANSFEQFTDEIFWDITRTFPYHTENKSARPVDAFVSEVPMVYDYEVNPEWHQVTFYNPDFNESRKMGIDISGEPVDGALALDANKSYHVYDFWNDRYVGIVSGSDRLEQELRGGEARMLSVRKVFDHPQVISTNRHIMQGYLDMKDVEWDAKKKELSGVSKVVGGDPYVITIAANGYKSKEILFLGEASLTIADTEDGIVKLTIESDENAEIEWGVKFQ